MLQSNRVLLDMGIPELDPRAFKREGRTIKPYVGGGGGGSSAPTSQTITQTTIPEYARPYAEEMLGQGQALTDISQNPYQAFEGQRFAGFSPMQAQAFQNVAGQQVAPQVTDASNLAYTGAAQGLATQPVAQGLQQTALGYGQAGAGYGGAASTLGLAGAQQAQLSSQQAQQAAQMYGGMGAQAGQAGMGYGAQGAQFGQQGAGFGAQGAQQAGQVAQQASLGAQGYGAAGAEYGAQGLSTAQQAQRAAEGQADIYGQMGAGFGAAGAGMAPEAQMYGAQGAGFGGLGAGYGAQGADIGGIGVQQAQQGFGAGAQYAQQATSPEAMQAYMSPYMQNVVDQQQREAIRQSQIQQQDIQAQAAQQGAFGGSRSAIIEAERQRNLGTQLGDIQGAGLQRAYEQAQQAQQFGAGLGIQGLQAGYQGLQAGMAGTAQGMQGAQTGIQGAQAGLAGLGQAGQLYGLGMQGAGLGLQGTGQRLAAGQLGLQGTSQAMQGSGLGLQGVGQQLAAGQLGLAGTAQGIQGAQAGIQGAQAGMQGAQTGISGSQAGLQGVGQQIAGAGLGLEGTRTGISGQQAGMQGAQTGLQGVGQATGAGQYGLAGSQLGVQGAGTLGQLGGQQFEQEMAITDAQQKYGALQQQQQQQGLDFNYQQFLAQQQYPYQQLSYMSDLLRGVPSSQSAQLQFAQQPDPVAQLAGTGLAAYGAFGRPNKEGGQVKKYQAGGQVSPDAMSTMAVQELPSQLRRLSDTQLAAYARTVKDAITLSAIQSELNRRQRARMPGDEPPTETTADQIAKRAEGASVGQPRVGMAGGGIVSLQAGGDVPMTQEEALSQLGILGPLSKVPGAVSSAGDWLSQQRQRGQQLRTQREQILAGQTPTPQRSEAELDAVQAVPPTPEELAYSDPSRAMDVAPTPQVPPPQEGMSGIAAAGRDKQPTAPSTGSLTFDQFRQMGTQVEPDPEDQAVLADMRSRIDKKLERAEGKQDTAAYDAMLMAGLAMMGGNSLADGIARAAQTGGATYLASREDAEKALDAAENAELSFDQYRMELRKGDKKAAQNEFNNYMDYALKLKQIDSQYSVGMARASSEASPFAEFASAQRVLNANKPYAEALNASKELAKQLEAVGGVDAARDSDREIVRDLYNRYTQAQQQVDTMEQQFYNQYSPGAAMAYSMMPGRGAASTSTGDSPRYKYDAQGNRIE